MESALYGIFTLVGFVSEISLVRCAHSFDFRYFTNSCENSVRTRFPWSNLYVEDDDDDDDDSDSDEGDDSGGN